MQRPSQIKSCRQRFAELFAALILPGLVGCYDKKNDRELIQTCFKNYKDAVINQDGKAGATLVDRKTLDHFRQLLDKILHAPKTEVEQLSITDKLFVLIARKQGDAEEFKKMSGADFFAWGINTGMTGKEFPKLELGRIEISGDDANAESVATGFGLSQKYSFLRENGEWKLNLLALFAKADQVFRQTQRRTDMNENEFVVAMIEKAFGSPVSETIWKPLLEVKK